ncbi:MAG: hypothetical protein JSW52_09955 [Candidatus Coatesbacteria bacterium]|nr:MAG: hypothetical protein JSW52_09955 [Candidatus Coatesbacteria bacterium]
MKAINVLIIFPILILGFAWSCAFASEKLQIGETPPIGEVGGITYPAAPHEPGSYGASFEIRTKTGSVYETVAELTAPAAEGGLDEKTVREVTRGVV